MEQSKLPPDTTNKDEISLKELILKLQGWWKYLLSRWLIIGLFGIGGGVLGLIYSLISKPKYEGELTFVLEESKSNPLSAYAGLASQFGVDFGGASSNGLFQGDNILEFLRSRLMIEKALLSPVRYNGVEMSLANLYIKFNELDRIWKEKKLFKQEINFPVNGKRSGFSLIQDSILNVIQSDIEKNNLEITKPDKKLSFISVKCTSEDEIFSKAFTEKLVSVATVFYVNTKTQRSSSNVNKLQATADSIEGLLNRKTYSTAVSQDLNLNPARQVAGVGTEIESRDKMVLQTMYAEVIKNLELSKMAMAQEMPIVQVVDTPILPLRKKKVGILKGVLIGGFIGGFLIIGYLGVGLIYREIMK